MNLMPQGISVKSQHVRQSPTLFSRILSHSSSFSNVFCGGCSVKFKPSLWGFSVFSDPLGNKRQANDGGARLGPAIKHPLLPEPGG